MVAQVELDQIQGEAVVWNDDLANPESTAFIELYNLVAAWVSN